MAFPETGIGIFPGLGGMLRFSRHAGPELAKYVTFTGAGLSAADLADLGIVTKLVAPAGIDAAVAELAAAGKPDKYKARQIPERFGKLAALCSRENVDRLLAGRKPEGVDEKLGEKTLKIIGYKAPLALKLADEIIDAQQGKPMTEAVEIELGRLSEVFSSEDALEGLSSLGRKRPEFKGK
jgi:enoyl-CoA hydratase/3-hydroxyacyl-CoA dehydrogenase